jgi:hypothetical protein
LRLLETLNLFAVRANYMAQFRDYLEREGVEIEPAIELPLFILANKQFLQRGLLVPRPPEGCDFAAENTLLLEPDPKISVQVDMSVRLLTIESTQLGLHSVEARAGQAQPIPQESMGWVDWYQAYLDLLAYKDRKGLTTLIIRPETPRRIIEQVPCTVVAEEPVVRPRSFEGCALLQEAVTHLLSRYLDRYYQVRREQWDEQTMVYRPLSEDDPNLGFNRNVVRERPGPAYVVKVPRSEQQLVAAIQKLLKDAERLYRQENAGLTRIHFDRHLYQPLLVEAADKVQMVPPGLVESEVRFVRDLRDYWENEKDKSLAGKEIYLLRNLSRGQGVGFFEERGFYPDFILWILDKQCQRIIFIEPHGMLHAKAYIHDEKARLHERLPALAEEIGKRSKRKDVLPDAYIISATSYNDVYKGYDDGTWNRNRFAERDILFQERKLDYDYVAMLFRQP